MSIYDPPMTTIFTYKNNPDIPKDAEVIGTARFKADIWGFNKTGVKILVSNILKEFENGNYKKTKTYQFFIEKKLYNKTSLYRTMIYAMTREVMISKGIEIFAWTTIRNIIFTNNLEFEGHIFQGIGMLGIDDFDYLFHDISKIVLNDNPFIKANISGTWNAFSRYFRKQWGRFHHISKPELLWIRFIVFGVWFRDHYSWFMERKFWAGHDLVDVINDPNPNPEIPMDKEIWGKPYPKCNWRW